MRTPRLIPNIVVSNLPEDVTASDLAELFDDYGLVLNAWIGARRQDATLPLRGWVDLAPAASVERAVASLDGQVFRTRKLKVKKAPAPVDVGRTRDGKRPPVRDSAQERRHDPLRSVLKPAAR